jgi:hypothetical protein
MALMKRAAAEAMLDLLGEDGVVTVAAMNGARTNQIERLTRAANVTL